MYKKEALGNNNKEHLFSPPLSFAPPLPWRAFFTGFFGGPQLKWALEVI